MNTNLTTLTHETIGSATIINDSIENALPFLESKSIGMVFIDIPIKHKLSDWRTQRFLRILDELYRVVKDDGRLVFIDRAHIGYSHVIFRLGDFIEICEEKEINPSEVIYEFITKNKADVKQIIEFKTNATREYKKKYEHLFAIGSHETGLLTVNEEPTYEITKKAKEKYLHEIKSQFLHAYNNEGTVLDLCQCCFHTCLAAAQANNYSIGVSGDVYYQNSKVELHNLASENKEILPFFVTRYEHTKGWVVKTNDDPINTQILIEFCRLEYETREEAIAAAKKCTALCDISNEISKKVDVFCSEIREIGSTPFTIRQENDKWLVESDDFAAKVIISFFCKQPFLTMKDAMDAVKKCNSVLTFKPKENEPI